MRKIISISCAVCILAAAIIATYRFGFRKRIPEAPVTEQVASILQQNDCFVCHSFNPAKPFYSSFPFIGKKMSEHISHAVRFVELEDASKDLSSASEVLLAKIETAVLKGDMPLVEYRMIHWGTGFNRKEKSLLAGWIHSARTALLGNETFADSPVQPVPGSYPYDSARADLGRRMYNDTRISLDNTISCATCHILSQGGADELDERTSEGINGNHSGVNAPTVYNAVFNIRQFWNGRAADLKEQAAGPPVNPMEMGDQTWDEIVSRLQTDKALVAEFEALYPGEGLTQSSVTDAIAEYEKTLITPDSRFDLYLKGDESALTTAEKTGYAAFIDNSCAACHVGKVMGGQSFEYLGVFGDYFSDRTTEIARNADDDGLKGFSGNDLDLEKFKVPGLRNVALTAPYFHDGSFTSLEDAVRAMFTYELGKSASDADVESITAFLGSLTGKHPSLDAR